MKRAKIPYTKKTEDLPKTATFYSTGQRIEDVTGKTYLLYYRGKAEYLTDIPIGKNQIGVIIKGYFWKIFDCHPYTLDFTNKVRRCMAQAKTIDFREGVKKKLEETL